MLYKLKTIESTILKLFGVTIYKRHHGSNEKYLLLDLVKITKNEENTTVSFLNFNFIINNKTTKLENTAHIIEKPISCWFNVFLPEDNDWLNIKPAKYKKDVRAIVILPVYKGYDETLCSIYHALKSRCDENYSLLVINDHGPDEQLNLKLKELAEQNLFDYHINENNLGFVKTINYAISKLSYNLDVVLLNSDAFVFDGWFNRLISYADENQLVGTITPLSNNATICSYPFTLQDNYISLELSPNTLDSIVSKVNKGLFVEVPTGVGFCFYMRRKVINESGLLDEDYFKLGYGEENDFCMRVMHNGYKNIVIGDVFVYHVGSVSFSDIKVKNMNAGENSLKIKHPNYFSLIESFIHTDSLLAIRRNIDFARLALKYTGCVVFISHKWGGGIETYLNHQIANLKEQTNCILLEVHDLDKITIKEIKENSTLIIPNSKNISLASNLSSLEKFFHDINPSLIHINSFAGLNWSTHSKLLEFFAKSNLNYKFILHDYGCMSYNYKLLSPSLDYHGIPTLEQRKIWEETAANIDSNINITDPYERRDKYYTFLKNCYAIESPSNRTKDIILYDFPELKIDVVPHENLLADVLPANRNKVKNKVKICSIGALSKEKGVGLLDSLAADALKRNINFSYSLVGYSDLSYKKSLLKNNVSITGKYDNNLVACKKIKNISPDLILLPSVWEETFSYTLSIALALKIPTIIFNIGAQAERTKYIDWVIKLDPILINNPQGITNIINELNIDLLWDKASKYEFK